MASAARLEIGTIFARDFRVVRPLAEGGMGAVYVVEQLSTRKQRALKVVRPDLVRDSKSRERFVQEAIIGANVQSDHVVEVISAGIDEATSIPWLVMELLDGEDLATLVARHGALPASEMYEICRQLCHALAAAHAVGVVHRDLKPENIFVARSRRPDVPFTIKLLDFGISKVVQESATSANTTSIVGSPLWMAPEQIQAGAIRPATDVWALGLIAFWMLTGRYYWRTANMEGVPLMGLLAEKLFDAIEPASARAAQFGSVVALPPGFDGWFAHCLAREPERRFRDAHEAFVGLGAALGAEAGNALAHPNATPWPMRAPADPRSVLATGPTLSAPTSGAAAYLNPTRVHSPVAPTQVYSGAAPGMDVTTGPRRDSASNTRGARSVFLPLAAAGLIATGAVAAIMVRGRGNSAPRVTDGPHADRSGVARDGFPLIPPLLPLDDHRTDAGAPTTIASADPIETRGARAAHRTRVAQPAPVLARAPSTSVTLTPTAAPVRPAPMRPPMPGPTSRTAALSRMLDLADQNDREADQLAATDPRRADGLRIASAQLRSGAQNHAGQLESQADAMAASDPDTAAQLRAIAHEERQFVARRLAAHRGP